MTKVNNLCNDVDDIIPQPRRPPNQQNNTCTRNPLDDSRYREGRGQHNNKCNVLKCNLIAVVCILAVRGVI